MTLFLPAGHRVYAVGDIHGMAHLLDEALLLIEAHLECFPAPHVTEVFLGDYVDRGPDSRGVIERLAAAPVGRERVCLMGNHEDAMRNALHDVTQVGRWLGFGGLETCLSFGIDAAVHIKNPGAIQTMLQAVLTETERSFLDGLKVSHQIGGTLFVHAGIRPGVPLADQTHHDMMWIREPFLEHDGPLPAHVVHGHTPVDAPDRRAFRTNIDTGAVYGGGLTVAVIDPGRIQFLTARGEEAAPPQTSAHGINSASRIRYGRGLQTFR